MKPKSKSTASQKSRSASGGNIVKSNLPVSRRPQVVRDPETPHYIPVPTQVDRPQHQMVRDYVECMIDPKRKMCRIPDGESRKTALVRSVLDIPIYANFDGHSDDGRFAVVAQPILGKDGTDPDTFKVALANPGFNVETTNWSIPTSYAQVVSGVNVRQDRYISQLTGSPTFFFGVKDGGTTSPTQPLGSNPSFDPRNYGTDIQTVNGPPTQFEGGPGVYQITFFCADSQQTVTVAGNATLSTTAENDNTAAPSCVVYILNASGNWTLTVACSADPVSSILIITPAVTTEDASWENTGAVTSVRPVAMSALFTATASDLINGGMVAAAYLPSATCASNWFTNQTNNGVGQLQAWENLAPLGYNGKLKEGAYCFWTPEDVRDLIFFPPENQNHTVYPCLAISGQMVPGTSVSGNILVGRYELVTVYEFTTNVPLWEQIRYVGSQALIDETKSAICEYAHAMANETHREFILRVLKAVGRGALVAGRFIYNNRDVIGPLAAQAAALF